MNIAPRIPHVATRPPSTGPTASELHVVCDGVWLGYDEEIVLRDVSLEVLPGRYIWLVGANGTGKSTLLRAIVGLLPPRRGRIWRGGGARPAGYVPQQQTLDRFFPMTTRAIVEMGLFARIGPWRRPSPTLLREVDAWLARLGLRQHAHKTLAELSGGMRQKTLLARALVTGARLMVLDEPASELDAASAAVIWGELKRRVTEEHCSVLAAHHGPLPEPIAGGDEWIAEVGRGHVRCTPRGGGSR